MHVFTYICKLIFSSLSSLKNVYKTCHRLTAKLVLGNNIQWAVSVIEFEKQLI